MSKVSKAVQDRLATRRPKMGPGRSNPWPNQPSLDSGQYATVNYEDVSIVGIEATFGGEIEDYNHRTKKREPIPATLSLRFIYEFPTPGGAPHPFEGEPTIMFTTLDHIHDKAEGIYADEEGRLLQNLAVFFDGDTATVLQDLEAAVNFATEMIQTGIENGNPVKANVVAGFNQRKSYTNKEQKTVQPPVDRKDYIQTLLTA